MADLLMLIGGTILAVAWLPQLVHNLRTHQVRDVSSLTVSAVALGVSLGEMWALAALADRWAYAVTNGVASLIMYGVLASVLVYRGKK